ncbi:long chain fatty alcohol oxidase [Trichoderma cornu-damae]|uniref:Long chain fatty alcohol oxidase n=1 Tax=Trichoderma cornu-damae TaxID=654480 RepID=A0A9P8QS55_9HYPO|nr:long chain fatty alcohol oxidase [Trichoderma cornu-damae]
MAVSALRAPVAVPLPPPPSDDFMTRGQWDTLWALLDGVLPSYAPASAVTDRGAQIAIPDDEFHRLVDRIAGSLDNAPSREDMVEFLAFRPSAYPPFRDDCVRNLALSPAKAKLAGVLGTLGTRTGSLLLTGYWSPVTQQPAAVREAIIKSWCASRFEALRGLAKSITSLAGKANGTTNPHFQKLCGYSNVPRDWRPAEGYDFKFVQLQPGDGAHEMATDVVIVGSGPGGGVSAKNLAEAGHEVLVVDKGYHFPPAHFPLPQDAALGYLFDHGGVYVSEDASASITAGSCWGGGGTVNWSVCFKLQDFVRREWAGEGLPLFTSPEFDECMDRVWKFIGASSDGIRHNFRNNMLLDACKQLGWHGDVANQNTANKEHYCGQCHLGCGTGDKRGPAVAWLPAAAEAGAKFMEGFTVERVLFGGDGTTATGVEGLWVARGADGGVHEDVGRRTQRKVVIRAKKVVLCAGALWSPVILMKSGVKASLHLPNPQLGRNLHLHPVNSLTSVHRKETIPWEGGIITSWSGEFENLDGKGHGVKLEPLCMVPYVTFSLQSWAGGLDAKLAAIKFRHLSSFIALARDRDTGRVFVDPETGEPRIEYTVSDFDRESNLEGIIGLAKVAYVGGATEIRAQCPGVPPFMPSAADQARLVQNKDPEFTDAAFGKWLRQIRAMGNKPPLTAFSSAHQMGTCRMSATESSGVVDERGSVWGKKNLYVADSSVFPSASGVNPMVTVMSVADWISRRVSKEL